MSDYGVTEKGFVLKRMDTIVEEIHKDLTEGFGFDTRVTRPSFLDVLVTTFAGQMADLWEKAQDSYYAKYPSTATGLNLDNAVQYGGIRRQPDRRTCYALHCTGDDGTEVRAGAMVATDTKPEIRLYAANSFLITRESCNAVSIRVAVEAEGTYSVTLNGRLYSYGSTTGETVEVLNGLAALITDEEYEVSVSDEVLVISDKEKSRNNEIALSENLTTASVTSIASFMTETYGRIMLPYGIVKNMVNNIPGFNAVTNMLEPIYGRLRETDVELRQSYMAKSAVRSSYMVESICAELLNNVPNVESATGRENNTDVTDEYGLPPHSVEIVVQGGDNIEIAEAIHRKRAGGIQTYGKIEVPLTTSYGDTLIMRFNRPQYVYAWLRITLYGNKAKLPSNYAGMVIDSVMEDSISVTAGTSLITQLLLDRLYDTVRGISYVKIEVASTEASSEVPEDDAYAEGNIEVTSRQKIIISADRIQVAFADS